MMVSILLLGLSDLVATSAPPTDPLTAAVVGILLSLLGLLGVNGAQSYQLSGIKSELHADREAADRRMKKVEARVEAVEDRIEDLAAADEEDAPPRARRKITGSHSTSRGRPPRDTSIRESGTRKREPRTNPPC